MAWWAASNPDLLPAVRASICALTGEMAPLYYAAISDGTYCCAVSFFGMPTTYLGCGYEPAERQHKTYKFHGLALDIQRIGLCTP